MQQIPCGRLVFIQVGSPSEALASECSAVRGAPWFSVMSNRLTAVFHADNIWAHQTTQYLLENARGTVTYIQVPKLIPFLTIPNGPEMEDACVKEALSSLVELTEGLEAAELLVELPMLVVSQLHVSPDTPPTLPLAIANALDMDATYVTLLEEARMGPCHAVELTTGKVILHA